MYYLLDDDGYIRAVSYDTPLKGGGIYTGIIPKDFEEGSFYAWKVEGGTLTYDGNRMEELDLQRSGMAEMQELLAWFENYDRQMMQYLRCGRLGQAYDRDIEALDRLAEEKQMRIRELRERRIGYADNSANAEEFEAL